MVRLRAVGVCTPPPDRQAREQAAVHWPRLARLVEPDELDGRCEADRS